MGIVAEQLEARVGSTTARLDGSLGNLPGFAGAEIDFRLVSPEPAIFEGLAGLRLPSEPGRGGRNQQLALAVARESAGRAVCPRTEGPRRVVRRRSGRSPFPER